MAQLRAKQLKLSKPGDMIIGDANSNGSILAMGTTAGQALVVKNTGTDKAPVLILAYDSVAGSFVTYDDTVTQLGASTVQDAIAKLKSTVGSLTGALVYTGTVDASTATFTPALSKTVATGAYYQVTVAGNKIPTNQGNGSGTDGNAFYESVSVGDAIVWNGNYWNVIAHIDTVVTGTAGSIKVTGTPDEGYVVTIDPTYIGQDSITTLGTITTGTWNGTDIDLSHGGTNTDLSKVSDNSMIFKSGTGVDVTTPPSGAATPAGSITTFTTSISDTNVLDSDPNTGLTTTTGSVAGKGATVKVETTKGSNFTIKSVTVKDGGTGYATGDTVNITGFTAGTVKVQNVDGKGTIQTIDASNLQGAYTSDTNTAGTGIASTAKSGVGKGATFDVTESSSDTFKITGFTLTNTGTGYLSGDVITVKSTIDGVPTVLGTISITGVSAGTAGAGTTYLSFDPDTSAFKWVDADSIAGAAEQTVEATDQFTFVKSSAGPGEIVAGANAVVTLTHLPIKNSLEVFLNGLRLGAADYTYEAPKSSKTKGTITLVDSSLGYSSEATDVIEISYQYIVS